MKNSFFSIFTPQEDKFFPILDRMADAVLAAAVLVDACIRAKTQGEVVAAYQEIREQHETTDLLRREIFRELHNTFITPFDREDINELAVKIDGVMDYIKSTAKKIMLYHPKDVSASALPLAELVRKGAELLKEAVDGLKEVKKRPKKVAAVCQQIAEIESKGDDVFEHFLIDLFQNQTDAIEIIKLKDIMHELERATDVAEEVGDIIKTIIVKYA